MSSKRLNSRRICYHSDRRTMCWAYSGIKARDRLDGSNDNALDSYSGGAGLEYRLGHCLHWLKFSSVSPGKCLANTSM